MRTARAHMRTRGHDVKAAARGADGLDHTGKVCTLSEPAHAPSWSDAREYGSGRGRVGSRRQQEPVAGAWRSPLLDARCVQAVFIYFR